MHPSLSSLLPVGAGDYPGDKTTGHCQAEPHILHKDSPAVEDPSHESEGPTVSCPVWCPQSQCHARSECECLFYLVGEV